MRETSADPNRNIRIGAKMPPLNGKSLYHCWEFDTPGRTALPADNHSRHSIIEGVNPHYLGDE
ncbi:hypothetical protein OG874_22550 [Nocardia sp. NBC_00565]|uniref:hypothetical protein n=1 Tax=Nocardia sp. NBC_00565 TaxID=2975993 RepID=UPI002E806B84|nr:hypothetical protein [Nocardia sp. NBC_00565]WUC07698.1 hypothetical protein OG874_22550 [Nocardia sp. NBC_00565]